MLTLITKTTQGALVLSEATSETYAPRVYSHHINLHHFNLALLFTLPFTFLLCISIPKIPKILYLSDLTLVSDREGIDKPFIMLVASSYRFVQVRGT